MNLRFQRSLKVVPGLRINISRSGAGVSVGTRGLHVGVDAKGREYASIGLPGTGLSVRQVNSGSHRQRSRLRLVVRVGLGAAALALVLASVALWRG